MKNLKAMLTATKNVSYDDDDENGNNQKMKKIKKKEIEIS